MPETEQKERVAGRELDAEIAERVFGWTRVSGNAVNPPYSTEIAAAWQVVEHMLALKYEPEFRYHVGLSGTLWAADFDHFDKCAGHATAGTLPNAICLAALAAAPGPPDAPTEEPPTPEHVCGLQGFGRGADAPWKPAINHTEKL